MVGGLSYKTKQLFFMLIKLSIVIGAFYFIHNRLTTNEHLNFTVFVDFLTENDVFSLKTVLFLLFLSFFNWFFEILKWQNLVQIIDNISFYNATKQSLAALTASLFTPNRIGDYLGRIFILEKGDRLDGTVATITGNISQLIITILMGSISLFYFTQDIIIDFLEWSPYWILIFRILILLIGFVLILIFLRFPVIENQLNQRFEIFKYPILRHLNLLSEYKRSDMATALVLSFILYLVYALQFYLLLFAFTILPLAGSIRSIASILFLKFLSILNSLDDTITFNNTTAKNILINTLK